MAIRQSGRLWTAVDAQDFEAILAKPTWSTRALLPDKTSRATSPSVTPEQLRHLLRLSALPQPSSKEQEKKMLEDLEDQIHFVKEIQRVDASNVEPLQSILDESPEAVKEKTIGLQQLKTAMSKERVVGRHKRIQRIEGERNERPDGDAWDGNALGYASRTKGKFFVFGAGSEGSAPKKDEQDQDLTTILDRSQRAELTILVAHITANMRLAIERNFHPSESATHESAGQPADDQVQKESHSQSSSSTLDKQGNDSQPSSQDRKSESSALSGFDAWRDSVLLRIGQVVNKHDEDETQAAEDSIGNEEDEPPLKRAAEDERSLSRLRSVYPPVDTPLSHLPEAKRLLILHALLLLLLSLEHYDARSRVLMLNVSSSLGLCIRILNGDEVKIARGLLDNALALSGNPEAAEASKKSDSSRKWKVGIASVTGAVLIGVTGGLAAPLVAAGLGTVMGGLGLGATAAAGYLGALAGSGVIVGGLFGAYGGRMTGKMVDQYAREVNDFAFIPIRGSSARPKDDKEAAQEDHRLRVTIGVTGWVTDEDDFVVPWRVVGSDSEMFALRWELEPLMRLGNAMDLLVTSAAWTAGEQIAAKTVFAGLLSAVALPLTLLKVTKVVDNPFSVAKSRADKAGEVLADALIHEVQGKRSVNLMGYSLGSRVIYSCLQSLARRGAYGIVETVVLMGSPVPSDTEDWRRLRGVVNGRLVNVYSENDSVLALLYRTSSLQMGVAGLQPVQDVPGVENFDVSKMISGHLRYQFLVGRILNQVGLQSIDVQEIQQQEAALRAKARRQEAERIQNERLAGVDPDKHQVDENAAADEENRLQRQLERRTQEHLPARARNRSPSSEGERPALPERPAIPRRPVPRSDS
ncbi:DUF726-domain-containing protein [Aspergillus taichungensis]|uniref:DUF726-domain-containing protein n=1 Tax=Aspergillus taichungensis TaxID=482145 RepID=A0A2J5HUH7_9EURO|nr:DUF726-domain-containing protein [Aspergillus taichungensis]